MKQAWLVIPLVLIVSMIGIVGMQESFGESEISLIGTSHGTSFDLRMSDDKSRMSGNISWNDESHSTLENLKVISKHNKLFIFDNTNNLKIMLKEYSNTKYLVLIKSNNDIKLRAMIDGTISSIAERQNTIENTVTVTPANQRNLFTALQDKIDGENKLKTENQLFRDQQLAEKQTKIQRAQEIQNEQLDRLNQEERDRTSAGFTSSEIIENYQNWRDTSTTELNTASTPTRPEPPVITTTTNQNNNSGVSVFLNIPTHTEWNDSFRYTILITDDNAHRYLDYFNGYVGNELGNVSVSGKIINPNGQTMIQFQGVTNQNGIYENWWLIPDRITTRGEYVIEAHATLLTNGGTTITEGDGTKTFFVVPERSANNARPTSDAGLDIHNISGLNVTLDGSASSDVDDGVLFYTWALTNGTVPETLFNPNTVNPIFTIPDVIDLFYFSLVVDDGRKSGVADTMIVSSLHSEAGANQTSRPGEIPLDGSGSWDALGHPLTYEWSFLDFPEGSRVSVANNISDSTAQSTDIRLSIVGNYTLNLRVSDGILFDDDFVVLEIKLATELGSVTSPLDGIPPL